METIVDNKKIWKYVVENSSISEQSLSYWETNIVDTSLFKIDAKNNKAYIECQNIFTKGFVETSGISREIKKTLNERTNLDLSLIFFTSGEKNKIISDTSPIPIIDFTDGIRDNYVFDNYVVSKRNRMLVQAAQAVVIRPDAGPYNPLFIHGNSGLGKTHLLHAIGNEIKIKMPHKQVKYFTSEEFGNEVVISMNTKDSKSITQNVESLKKEYERADILLIDDIQFIASRPKTKELFFTILNKYIDNNKQIVITSDSSPEELNDFEERFITRFKKGLTLSISPPDLETARKIVILKLKRVHMIDDYQKILTDEALEFISLNFSKSVRELEGVINKLMFMSINNDIDVITLNHAISILGDIKKNKISVLDIKKRVSKFFNISIELIDSTSRKKDIMIARHISIYLTKDILKLPLKKIGMEFGGRDHTTIMNSINKIEKQRKIDPLLNNQLSQLNTLINKK